MTMKINKRDVVGVMANIFSLICKLKDLQFVNPYSGNFYFFSSLFELAKFGYSVRKME